MKSNEILIIKVGTSTLTKLGENNLRIIDKEAFVRIGKQVLKLKSCGYGVIIVSSAAISAGMAQTGLHLKPDKNSAMPELQRLASIGWRHVLNSWAEALSGYEVGEILLTKREITDTTNEAAEFTKVVCAMLEHNDIPIINENDTITHSEISFGDNDTLAARVAVAIGLSSLCKATIKLLILSDVNGVYSDINDTSTIIRTINDTEKLKHLAGNSISSSGTGGMITKFLAAKIAATAGIETWISNGKSNNILHDMIIGKEGTHFQLTDDSSIKNGELNRQVST